MVLARRFRMRRDGLQTPLEKCIRISAKIDEMIDDEEGCPDIKLFKKFFKKSFKIANLIASGTGDYMHGNEVISKRGNIGSNSSEQSLIYPADSSSERRRLDQI